MVWRDIRFLNQEPNLLPLLLLCFSAEVWIHNLLFKKKLIPKMTQLKENHCQENQCQSVRRFAG